MFILKVGYIIYLNLIEIFFIKYWNLFYKSLWKKKIQVEGWNKVLNEFKIFIVKFRDNNSKF